MGFYVSVHEQKRQREKQRWHVEMLRQKTETKK